MTQSFTNCAMRACPAIMLTLMAFALPVQAADHAAADAAALRKAIQTHSAKDKEFALENALRSLQARAPVQIEAVRRSESDPESCIWPSRKPADVTKDEWRALRRSLQPQVGEMGCSTYLLVDMNEDGRRDLLESIYVGGTGLFSYYYAYKRRGQRFVLPNLGKQHDDEEVEESGQELFSTNERGANQWYELIRLQGRFYIAYVEGSFGQDNVTLLRPTDRAQRVAKIQVSYRYQFSVPRRQTFGQQGQMREVVLRPALQTALEAALARHVGVQPAQEYRQMCPAPAGASEEEAATYAGFGPGHYSFETLADFPVWWQGRCHVAQFISWFGRYDRKSGLFNQLRVRRADRDEEGLEYEVLARRGITKVSAEP